MSSTVVVNPAAGLAKIAEALEALREEAELVQVEPDLDPSLAAAYRLIGRDLFNLTTKTRALAWGSAATADDAAGMLRVNELALPGQIALMQKMAGQLARYVGEHGGSVDVQWALEAVAKRMHTTVDEIYHGLNYAEQDGLLFTSRDRRTLSDHIND